MLYIPLFLDATGTCGASPETVPIVSDDIHALKANREHSTHLRKAWRWTVGRNGMLRILVAQLLEALIKARQTKSLGKCRQYLALFDAATSWTCERHSRRSSLKQ